MGKNATGPKKLPHGKEEFLDMERRLGQIQANIRELRTRMGDAEMQTVELKLGTFSYFLDRMEPLVKQFMGELEQQIAVRDVQAKRMQKIAEKANKTE